METYGPSQQGAAWRLVLSIVSGLALIASTFTPWGYDHRAYNIGADALFTSKATVNASFLTSVGLLTLVLGILALLGLIPRRGWLTTAAGVGGVIVAMEFLITHLIRADFPWSRLDYGWYLLLLSVLALPAAFVGTRPEGVAPPGGIPSRIRTTTDPSTRGRLSP